MSTEFFQGRPAAILAAVLLLGLAALALFARTDRTRVTTLETFTELSAVGDKTYYLLPQPLPAPPAPVAQYNGRALIPITYEKFEWRDTKMTPVARDPQTRLTIYTSREPLPKNIPPAGETPYFVKTAANEYLRLRAAPREP